MHAKDANGETKLIPIIFDDKDGIIIQFDFENGFAMGVKLIDEEAEELINIIQNKINSRFGK